MNRKLFPEIGDSFSTFEVTEYLMHRSLENSRPFQRICELMRHNGARSVLILNEISEELWFKEEYENVTQYLNSVKEDARLLDVAQVSFWSLPINSINRKVFPKGARKTHLLGVCFIVTLQAKKPIGFLNASDICSSVYEAIIRLPGSGMEANPNCLLEDYCHVFSETLLANIDGHSFSLKEPHIYFCQNDSGISSVCPQTSLKSSLYHVEYPNPKKMTFSEMNNFVEELRENGSGAPGFTTDETIAFLKHLQVGPECLWLNLEDEDAGNISPYEFAYLLLESGIPALIIFRPFLTGSGDESGQHHVVSAIGHTMNYHEWLPLANAFYPAFDEFSLKDDAEKGYVSSSNWAPHLIIHDDLLGPYHCLREFDLIELVEVNGHSQLRSRIAHVIGIAPESYGFTVNPYVIQQIAASSFKANWKDYLDKIPKIWAARFNQEKGPLNDPSKLVLRTQIISKHDYIKHLREVIGQYAGRTKLKRADERMLEKKLPDKFWITEFSCPEVYSVHSAKIGEMLLKFAPIKSELYEFGQGANAICFGFRFINVLEIEAASQKKHIIKLGFQSHTKLYKRKRQAMEFE